MWLFPEPVVGDGSAGFFTKIADCAEKFSIASVEQADRVPRLPPKNSLEIMRLFRRKGDFGLLGQCSINIKSG